MIKIKISFSIRLKGQKYTTKKNIFCPLLLLAIFLIMMENTMCPNAHQREPNSHDEHSYIDVDSQKYKGEERLKREINIPLVLACLLIDHSRFSLSFSECFQMIHCL